jgi:hypothetical protein
VWDDEQTGGVAAFIPTGKLEPLWYREFGSQGARPAIASSPTGEVVVSWFEGKRVRIAQISQDGLEEPSVLGRVSGYQPYPAIVAGKVPGQWYVSWRDYEAGQLEAFIVRADCQSKSQ